MTVDRRQRWLDDFAEQVRARSAAALDPDVDCPRLPAVPRPRPRPPWMRPDEDYFAQLAGEVDEYHAKPEPEQPDQEEGTNR